MAKEYVSGQMKSLLKALLQQPITAIFGGVEFNLTLYEETITVGSRPDGDSWTITASYRTGTVARTIKQKN